MSLYIIDIEEYQRLLSYGGMFRDSLISLSSINPAFSRLHQNEVIPMSLSFESEQAYKTCKTGFLKLMKELDELSLITSRQVLFGELSTNNVEELTQKVNKILFDVYRQKKLTRKTVRNYDVGHIDHKNKIGNYAINICGYSKLTRALFKYRDHQDLFEVISGERARKAFFKHFDKEPSQKKINRWMKQNINRFKMSKQSYYLEVSDLNILGT